MKMNERTKEKDAPLNNVDQVNERHFQSSEALLQLLRSGLIPVTSIESKHFREMVYHLDKSYSIPTVSTPHFQQQEQSYMKGFYLKDGRLSLRKNLSLPVLKKEEALIRIVRAGICATDQHMSQGYKGGFEGILGHEFVGVVEKVENCIHNEWIGKRVVGEINLWCGKKTCDVCSQAEREKDPKNQIRRRNHCPNRSCLGILNKDGSFAEYISLPVRNLFQVPSNVSDSEAVFAEPLAAACRLMEQQLILSTDKVAVLGDGKLGLLITSVIHAYGLDHQVTIIGKHKEKLNILPKEVNKVLIINESFAQTHHQEFDVVVECTGSPSGIEFACLLIKKEGLIVMKSTCSASTSNVNLGLLCEKQVTIHGSRCGPFEKAIELLTTKKIDVQKFVEAVYTLEEAHKAFAHAAERGALKIQLQMIRRRI
jgi:threonine dehydrogenase-like Zn-dependent dehydrogenase